MTRQPFLDFKQRVVPRGWVGDTEEGGVGNFHTEVVNIMQFKICFV